VVKSPNLDALAARGLVFERAYCQQALCSPSRISLPSGRRPATTKIYSIGPTLRGKLPDVVTLLPHFKQQGYFARSLGKIFHVGIDDTHVPWVAPKNYRDKVRDEDLKLPDSRFPPRDAPKFAATTGSDFKWYGNVPKNGKITPEFGRDCIHGYLAAISYVDAQIGLLLAELDRLGLRENTVVIFCGPGRKDTRAGGVRRYLSLAHQAVRTAETGGCRRQQLRTPARRSAAHLEDRRLQPVSKGWKSRYRDAQKHRRDRRQRTSETAQRRLESRPKFLVIT